MYATLGSGWWSTKELGQAAGEGVVLSTAPRGVAEVATELRQSGQQAGEGYGSSDCTAQGLRPPYKPTPRAHWTLHRDEPLGALDGRRPAQPVCQHRGQQVAQDVDLGQIGILDPQVVQVQDPLEALEEQLHLPAQPVEGQHRLGTPAGAIQTGYQDDETRRLQAPVVQGTPLPGSLATQAMPGSVGGFLGQPTGNQSQAVDPLRRLHHHFSFPCLRLW